MEVVCNAAKFCTNIKCHHHDSHEPVCNDSGDCTRRCECNGFQMEGVDIRKCTIIVKCEVPAS